MEKFYHRHYLLKIEALGHRKIILLVIASLVCKFKFNKSF